jgi:hypothetical protein
MPLFDVKHRNVSAALMRTPDGDPNEGEHGDRKRHRPMRYPNGIARLAAFGPEKVKNASRASGDISITAKLD